MMSRENTLKLSFYTFILLCIAFVSGSIFALLETGSARIITAILAAIMFFGSITQFLIYRYFAQIIRNMPKEAKEEGFREIPPPETLV